MASLDTGGSTRQPHVPMEVDRHSPPSASSAPSDRGYGAQQALPSVCQWRTARYHDQECSRYFDCPSHVVERAPSDDGQEREDEERQDVESQDTQPVSPISGDSEEESEGEETLRARSPSPEVPVAASEANDASLEARRAAAEGPERGNSGLSSTSPAFLGDDQPLGIQPRAESERQGTTESDSRDGDGGMQTALGPMPMPRTSRVPLGLQPVDRPAASVAATTGLAPGPSPSLSTAAEHTSPSEMVLPRWQPDSEVTYCPFCGTQFSFFVRKHHCRKCGRVVCNACSPHRITIPYQYIVRPPGTPPPIAHSAPLSLLDSQGWYPGFGGGERVRLCNPCVPDPNTAPPQPQGAQGEPARDQTNPRPRVQPDDNTPSNRWGVYFGSGTLHDTQGRSRSVTVGQQLGTMSSPQPHFPPHRSAGNRILWGTPPVLPTATASQSPFAYPGMASVYRSTLESGARPGPSTLAGPSSSSSASISRRLPFAPRPQIPEEDECPVCHRELPPRTLPNFESLREAHINNCITAHSRYGGRSGAGTSAAATSPGGEDELPPVPPRRTGMFPYTATEKDCVDSAECSICLEEFEVGVAMARLECLCRFHRACINAWWERHPGRCPMHQHDGFGY
ncbi:FYVE zinc finger-domain-containing protein [Chaetomium strumarium]|uniref:FYVE zinc finger-domain-containing protein n=1 Tax=Chaetomium strumarium TaxID=1170767 RepID=A0AAJ0H1T5_9PEZI|nr:FYVE zinc finger-domain-containing protein [Chaetomium strumarium]